MVVAMLKTQMMAVNTTVSLFAVQDGSANDNSGSTEVQCRAFHTENISDVCAFVKNNSDCDVDDGFVDYTDVVYCTFTKFVPLGVTIMFFWWLFLFCGLAVTADKFFCPTLAVISRTMRLSHNIAGVTFLAFGNGAPDIFSAISAIGNAKGGDAGLAIGALFGAGVFVSTVVVGAISITQPFDCMQRPFLRDVIFFIAAVFWAFTIMWRKRITTWEAAGFVIMYAVYVAVIVVGRLSYASYRRKNGCVHDPAACHPSIQSDENSFSDSCESHTQCAPTERTPLLKDAELEPTVQIEKEIPVDILHRHHETLTPVRAFMAAINPIDTEGWKDLRIWTKVYEIFKCPLVLALKLTVPVVDDEGENMKGWNRHLQTLQCVTGPLLCIFATNLAFELSPKFPAYAVVLVAGSVLSIIVFLTSKNDHAPRYHDAFAYLGFLVAVIWIYSIANEIVNLLQMFGIVLNISNSIIGLTLLAWGNSVSDFVADVTMARQGYPRMGISACFGGPLFNILLGIGIPFTIACLKKPGGVYELEVTLEELYLAGAVTFSLVSSLVIMVVTNFHMSRAYGIYLVIVYVVFLTVALLIEMDVIKNTEH